MPARGSVCGPGEGQGKEKPRFFAPAPWAPGAKKNTPWVVFFFCSGPAERSWRPTERNKKKHFAHPGPTAKNFLETNDAGHEQKGATTKKKHPGRAEL